MATILDLAILAKEVYERNMERDIKLVRPADDVAARNALYGFFSKL
jgi:hypothetical protein